MTSAFQANAVQNNAFQSAPAAAARPGGAPIYWWDEEERRRRLREETERDKRIAFGILPKPVEPKAKTPAAEATPDELPVKIEPPAFDFSLVQAKASVAVARQVAKEEARLAKERLREKQETRERERIAAEVEAARLERIRTDDALLLQLVQEQDEQIHNIAVHLNAQVMRLLDHKLNRRGNTADRRRTGAAHRANESVRSSHA
jgi:hypothetical protein